MAIGKIVNGINPLKYALETHPEKCSMITENPQLQEVLELCLKQNYEERPRAALLLEHQLFDGKGMPKGTKERRELKIASKWSQEESLLS